MGQLFMDDCVCCVPFLLSIIYWLQHCFEHFERFNTSAEMVILWPLCRSHQLICPPAIQATLHWQSPANAQICLVPTIPRTPSRPLHRCLSCKVLSCNRCPTASCRVTPAGGTLRTSTNLSPLCPVGPGWSHYRRFVKVLESCLHTLLMHPSSGRDTTSWTIFLSDIFIFSVERCLFLLVT